MKYLILFFLPLSIFASIPAQFQGEIQAKWISDGESDQVINKDLGYVSADKVRIFEEMFYVESTKLNEDAAMVTFTTGDQAIFGYDVDSRARLMIFIVNGETYGILY